MAAQIGVEYTWLAKEFRRDRTNAYLKKRAAAILLAAVTRAAQVKVELLNGENAKVASEIASEILALAGIKADAKQGQTVNVNVSPGYVVRLETPPATPPAELKAITLEASEVEPDTDLDRLMADLG